METLLLFGIAGMLAQLVDGTLGMGYGATSATALVAFGTPAAIASASVHLAKVGTSLASGVSHWKFRNVDWRTVGILTVPGAFGAIGGAILLVSLSNGFASVLISTILFLLGLYVLIRFAFLRLGKLIASKRPGAGFLGPLGLVAGFVDATGGGGWGPVATTALLSSGRLEPRKVVGSVSAAEFVVSVAASVAFFFALATEDGMNFLVVAGLLVGGVVAAPFAAWLVRLMPPQVLGTAAGGMIVLTNAWLLLQIAGAGTAVVVVAYVVLVLLWVAGLAASVVSAREEKRVNALVGEDGPAGQQRESAPR